MDKESKLRHTRRRDIPRQASQSGFQFRPCTLKQPPRFTGPTLSISCPLRADRNLAVPPRRGEHRCFSAMERIEVNDPEILSPPSDVEPIDPWKNNRSVRYAVRIWLPQPTSGQTAADVEAATFLSADESRAARRYLLGEREVDTQRLAHSSREVSEYRPCFRAIESHSPEPRAKGDQ